MKKIILILIVLLGLVLRVFKLDSRPVGFTWDEAALGYNAYSLLKTGHDEYGQFAPLVFKSFGDYKPGLYIYTSVLPIKLLGLTELSVRLPSAIFGTILILLVYLLVKELFGGRSAIFSAFTVSIMPWAIHFSRASWEANISLSLTTLATLLFLKRRYSLSALFFGLTFWTYQGAKLFTPLLAITLFLLYKSKLQVRQLVKPALIGLTVILPIMAGVASQSGRLKVFSVFSYTRQPESVQSILDQDNSVQKDLGFYLFHSELLDQVRGIVQRYLNHFSPRYLFFAGDWSNPRQSTPYSGYLYLPEILTLLLGLRFIIKSNNPHTKLILAWLLLSPIPSALSRDIVSAVRSLPLLLPLSIVSGIGLSQVFKFKVLKFVYLGFLSFFLIYFLDLYFIHSSHYTAQGWLYPYKPSLKVVSQHMNSYNHVVLSPKLGQPYIFALFYLQIDPKSFQSQAKLTESPVGDVGYVSGFDKFEFRPIYWPNDRGLSSTIFVGDQYELPESDLRSTPNALRLSEITYPNGSPGLRVVGLP